MKLYRLVLKQIKYNKFKSRIVLTTILLTTMLLTVVGTLGLDYMGQRKYKVQVLDGNFHVLYKNVTLEQYNQLKQEENIETLGLYSILGIHDERDGKLLVSYSDENHRKMVPLQISEGVYPVKKNEILIDKEYLEILGYEPRLGQKIILSYSINYQGDKVKREDEFMVVGLHNATASSKIKKIYGCMMSGEFFNQEVIQDKVDLRTYVRINNENELSSYEIETALLDMAKRNNIQGNHVSINKDYLASIEPQFDIIIIMILLMAIIIISAIIVIYSIFYMGIIEKVKEYGKLRAIGITRRQVKKMVLLEGLYLCSIGIPLGLTSGALASYLVMLRIRSNMVIELANRPFFNINIFILCSLITCLSVIIALIKPMKKAVNISPIQAIKYNGDTCKSYNKSKKRYLEMDLLKLVKLNLSRYKKRTILTIVSLTFSGIIFIIISTFANGMKVENAMFMTTDFMVFRLHSDDLNVSNPLSEELINRISSTDSVDSLKIKKNIKVSVVHGSTANSYDLSTISKEEDYYRNKLVKGKLDISRIDNDGEIIISCDVAEKENLNIGDMVELKLYDGADTVIQSFKVQAVGDFHFDEFYLTNDTLNNIVGGNYNEVVSINAKKESYDMVNEMLTDLTKSNNMLSLIRYKDMYKIQENAIQGTKFLLYSIAFIISIICLINLINTLITSIISRKRELSIIQALGLTGKQTFKMFNIEASLYVMTSLLLIIIVGNSLGYITFTVIQNQNGTYLDYNFPLTSNLILIFIALITQFCTSKIMIRLFEKQSLIERIKYTD